MTVYETQIRTGNPAWDQQTLDQLRRQYERPGLALQVQPMPGGGLHVRVVQAPQYGSATARAPSQAPPFGAPPYGAQPAFAGVPEGAALPLGAQRVRYLRKVYGLLTVSAIVAIAGGWVSTSPLLGVTPIGIESGKVIQVPLLVALMLQNRALEYGAFALLFVGVLVASMVSKVRGLNYLALFGVSILMGVELAPMVFVAQVLAGMGATMTSSPVEATFAMVGAIFVGLTAYVLIARKDFSYLGATLSMGFFVVLAGAFVASFVASEPLTLAIASVGALLSIGFLLYQTSWILNNSDMDDPVDDALGLLVQLRNLFMFLLRIFMSRR